ncbi:MAG: hypothetical protein NC038_07730 [Paludibacter sp.]|nr:hypothetical protein [Bacteroidales bacterium]MCM1069946.1 hypothetical protein [Prevotella sp.]MCM1354650.1 hypothetical protein [Bacteroides sp.]MCM1443632.1 hypothetical protein [Muribaculum sp.]MCM1482507.1 hypothetical protein [Paludibacter sp.]
MNILPFKQNILFNPPLWMCLLFDAIGCVSYFVPGWGEWLDVLWAPLAALLFYCAFGGKTGKVGAVISFVEELLPFTDILPLFTLGWFVRRSEKRSADNAQRTVVKKKK